MNLSEAKRLYADGLSTLTIARMLGGSQSTVWRRLREAGVQMRTPYGRGGSPRKADRNAAIVADREAGMTFLALSVRYGLSTSRIHCIVKRDAPGLVTPLW